jgi:hypothetical protein
MASQCNASPQLLILTATITPPGDARNLVRLDPQQRLQDYKQGLAHYIELLKQGVLQQLVFAENSLSDLSELEQLCRDHGVTGQVEFVSFFGLDYPPGYGRGYGEFKLLDHAMRHSQFVAAAPEQARIWKVTGRYRLMNFAALIRKAPATLDFYCHCRNHPMVWVDLYVLAWSKRGYREVVEGLFERLREDTSLASAEKTFRAHLDGQAFHSKVVKRFSAPPELEGVRGLDNQSYQEMNLKLLVRKVAQVLTPWIWI